MFRSFSSVNYRFWFAGAIVSNVGTWMQRTAQDWIVLTELTDHDAIAVGITMALQFAPQLVLSPWTGLIADRVDRRKLLALTQTASALLALLLGVLVLTGVAHLFHVYALALLLGVAAALDAPARQTFVAELVTDRDLPNAVALNSASFNGARLIGPAVAGVLIALVGSGWVFIINAVSYAAVLGSLAALRSDSMRPMPRAPREKGQIRAGFAYVRSRPDVVTILVMVFLVGTFGLNFAIFTSTMATVEFGRGATEFGLLSSIMAVGSVAGALLAARRDRPRMRMVMLAAAGFGATCTLSAFMPTYETFAASLALIGLCSLTMMTSANAYVQSTTSPALRGRVMALYMAIFMGGTPIGAPLVGAIANAFGPRWALGVAAASGFVAAAVCLGWLARHHEVRWREVGHPRRLVQRLRARGPLTGAIAVVEATGER